MSGESRCRVMDQGCRRLSLAFQAPTSIGKLRQYPLAKTVAWRFFAISLHKAKRQLGERGVLARALAGLLAMLVLAVSFIAASPVLHSALHGHESVEEADSSASCDHVHGHDQEGENSPGKGSSDPHESCVICLFAHGAVMQTDVAAPVAPPVYQLPIAGVRPESAQLPPSRFLLLPERAPPRHV